MPVDRKIALLVSLPELYFDSLRRMVAKRLLKNPRVQTSAATIAREIICEHLDHLLESQNKPNTEDFADINPSGQADDKEEELKHEHDKD